MHAPFQSDPRFADHYKDSGKPGPAQAFATLIEGMDKSLGDLMDKLKETGQWENTIIIFMSDNGQPSQATLNEPLRGHKLLPYEGGVRVPLIVYWPGNDKVERGSVNSQYVHVDDLFPSILDMAGVKADEIDVVLCNTEEWKEYMLWTAGIDLANEIGAIVCEADRDTEAVLTHTFDLAGIADYRREWGVFRDRRPDLYGTLLTLDGKQPAGCC